MNVKFITTPESNCSTDKQSWNDVAKLLRNNLQSEFGNNALFKHIEFMSPEWFDDSGIVELSETHEIKFPLILINNDIFSNGEKVNISKIIKTIKTKVK